MDETRGWHGRVVVVTGGSEGIGRAIAARMASLGAQVVITGRNAERLAAATEVIAAAAGSAERIRAEQLDAGEREAGEFACASAINAFGRIDAVVANAAYVPPMSALLDADDADIDRVWQVNVAGPLRLVRAAARSGMSAHGGAVVILGSLGGISLQPGMGLYGASKAALHHLTRYLAGEVGPRIRVNAIAPGIVRTPGTEVVWATAGDSLAARSPSGRLGEADDVADAAEFLLSPRASWITGEVLVLDGGASVQWARGRTSSRR